ncbi:hypothetical protein BDV10DRAFT_188587 [Aspergillus recurvatus]
MALAPRSWRSREAEAEAEAPSQRNRHQPEPATNASSAIAEGRPIHTGNLPYSTKEHEIAAFLNNAGYEFSKLDISTNPFSGWDTSYCFGAFNTKDKADQVMTDLNGPDTQGETVHVKRRSAETTQMVRALPLIMCLIDGAGMKQPGIPKATPREDAA